MTSVVMFRDMRRILRVIYSREAANKAFVALKNLMDVYGRSEVIIGKRKRYNDWVVLSEKHAVPITYPDTIYRKGEKPLTTLHHFLKKHIKDAVTAVHILPFFPSSSDGGYAVIEPYRPRYRLQEALKTYGRDGNVTLTDLVAMSVETTLKHVSPSAVFVPTRSGYTARNIARFRLPVWITAISSEERTCQGLQFSYGVYPVHKPEHPEDWRIFAREWLRFHGLEGNLVVLTEGPSRKHPEANNRMELIDLNSK